MYSNGNRIKKNKAMRWFFGFSILVHAFILFHIGGVILSHSHIRRIEVELQDIPKSILKDIPRPQRRQCKMTPKASPNARFSKPQHFKTLSCRNIPKKINHKVYKSGITEAIAMPNFASFHEVSNVPISLPDNLDRTKEELNRYRQIVWKRIHDNLRYPQIAQKRGLIGDIEVEFIVDKDGNVTECTILKSSGHSILDEAGLSSIKRVKLPPLPYTIKESTYPMVITLKYRLSS
ncbi:MAG: energy transducer TonB [bacterium]